MPHWDELDPAARRVAARFMETYAGFAEHTDHHVGRLLDTIEELGVLDDTLVLYLLGDNGASGEGGPEGTIREHLVGHGYADDVADMEARLDEIGSAITYGMYPVGWALAMNTPYQWTKQVASHFGGIRDGLVVHWPNGIEDRGTVRHQFHHVIDVLPTILEAAGVPVPETVQGVTQQDVEGTSMHYCFDDPDAGERRTRQYFEMIGNRAIYDQGWTAGRPARHPVADGRGAATVRHRPVGALRHPHRLEPGHTTWPREHPERVRAMQEAFEEEARRYHVFPLDDRVTERENPQLAGRHDLQHGRTSVVLGPRRRAAHGGGRPEHQEPVVQHRGRPRHPDELPPQSTQGVLVAQGGRFGGWSLYVVDGRPHYAYNLYGKDLTVVRADSVLWPGRHRVAFDFEYDGGPPGSGGGARIRPRRREVGSGRVEETTAYYFSFDETFDVGVDRGTPVIDDYPPVRNRFTGRIRQVRIDLGPQEPLPREAADHHALKQMD